MRRNPFEELEDAIERMSKGFEGGMAPTFGESVPVDVADRDGKYVVTADLPGFTAEDIEVTLDDGVLRIEADREGGAHEESVDEEGHYIFRERTRTSVARSVRLPEAVDEESVSANHSNGVLTVELPKHRHSDEGHSIEVE